MYGPRHVMFAEPDEVLANECVLVMFLRMAVLMGGLATGMLGACVRECVRA